MAIKTIKEESLTALGDAIREKTNTEDLLEFPSGMVEAIESIPDPVELPDEAFVFTGNGRYMFSDNHWNWFIEKFGDQITTQDLTSFEKMFLFSKTLKSIPFSLNGSPSTKLTIQDCFSYCEQLEQLPKINATIIANETNSNIFKNCYRLREIPDEIVEGIVWEPAPSNISPYSGSKSDVFNGCYSLRKYPNSILIGGANPKITPSYSIYPRCFMSNYVLDEIVDLPVLYEQSSSFTSNAFSSTFDTCSRLKKLTFQTNEDGSPIIRSNWSKQTIDLSKNIGWAANSQYILKYNSGITADKCIATPEDYVLLKDDPDCYTLTQAYSRYNHDSAVETINSLPDLSGGGGGNTIKFKKGAGSATDGGAISTLTEEEIAVATAKGWTVTLVA